MLKHRQTAGDFDVYSFGVVSSSTLYSLCGAFPESGRYAEIDEVRHMTGGEATNSSIVLARLGVRVRLDGNWLGTDDAGKRTRALLSGYGIDISRLTLRDEYKGVQEVVFAAAGTRTIFGTYGRLLGDAHWNMPREEDVRRAKVVCLDPFFKQASARAAELAFGAGIPVVTVDCPHDAPWLRHVSAVVIAEAYIQEHYAGCSLENLFSKYQQSGNGLVIFTFGPSAIWYARPDEPVKQFQPYVVEAVDTTGGGDAFRAGIVYGFLRGWEDSKMIDFAAAVAALVCSRFPGVLPAPTFDEVVEFRRAHKK